MLKIARCSFWPSMLMYATRFLILFLILFDLKRKEIGMCTKSYTGQTTVDLNCVVYFYKLEFVKDSWIVLYLCAGAAFILLALKTVKSYWYVPYKLLQNHVFLCNPSEEKMQHQQQHVFSLLENEFRRFLPIEHFLVKVSVIKYMSKYITVCTFW